MKPGITIIIFGIILIACMAVYFYVSTRNDDRDFVRSRQKLAESLFERIERFDPDEYPDSPLAVMELYCAVRHFLYGDMVLNQDILRYAFDVKRMLYTREALETLDEEEEYAEFLNAIAEMRRRNQRIHSIKVGTESYHSLDPTVCYITIEDTNINAEPRLSWQYILIFEDDKWKIGEKNLLPSSDIIQDTPAPEEL
jgi:hypothetical protein